MEDEIIMKIPADGGSPVISVKGVKGTGCKDLTKSLEKALGETISDTPTREMREEPETNEHRNRARR